MRGKTKWEGGGCLEMEGVPYYIIFHHIIFYIFMEIPHDAA